MMTYKTYLRAVGRKPLPPSHKLRTTPKPGDVVLGVSAGRNVAVTV